MKSSLPNPGPLMSGLGSWGKILSRGTHTPFKPLTYQTFVETEISTSTPHSSPLTTETHKKEITTN